MTTYWPIWDCLTEECKRRLMLAGWRQPNTRRAGDVIIDCEIEDIEEISRLMEESPRYPEGITK